MVEELEILLNSTIRMVIQLVNIVGGFVLGSPKIKQWVSKEHVENAEQKLSQFRGMIGIVALVIGGIAFLGNLGLFSPFFFFPGLFWAPPLQSLAAIAIGLILSANLFIRWPKVSGFISKLEQHGEWVGLAGIIIGILGLL